MKIFYGMNIALYLVRYVPPPFWIRNVEKMFSGTKNNGLKGESKMNKEWLGQLRFKAHAAAVFCGVVLMTTSFNSSASTSTVLCFPCGTVDFGTGGDSLTYRVSNGNSGDGYVPSPVFSYNFTLGGSGTLTNLEIPLFNASNASTFTGPTGWSSTILTKVQPGWDWSYAGGTASNGKTIFNASSNVIDTVVSFSGSPVSLSSDPAFSFISNFAPVMAPYQLTVAGGGTTFVDPPTPGPSPVPEPAPLLLIGVGLLGLVSIFRCKGTTSEAH